MSIFGSIMHKIFSAAETAVMPSAAPAPIPPADAAATASGTSSPATQSSSGMPAASAPTAAPSQPVDVEAVLTQMASTKGDGGNWQTSIVDLLKLLDLDSSLGGTKRARD